MTHAPITNPVSMKILLPGIGESDGCLHTRLEQQP